MEKTSIKEWYTEAYPTDEYGEDIFPHVTFQHLVHAMHHKICVYEACGFENSIVRERVFAKLADIQGVEYRVIYNLWLQ